MRKTKATLIYRKTKNLRALQLLLGHTKLESTVRYLGIERNVDRKGLAAIVRVPLPAPAKIYLHMEYQQVIDFWFPEIAPGQWRCVDESFDRMVRERFGAVHARPAKCEETDLLKTPASSF